MRRAIEFASVGQTRIGPGDDPLSAPLTQTRLCRSGPPKSIQALGSVQRVLIEKAKGTLDSVGVRSGLRDSVCVRSALGDSVCVRSKLCMCPVKVAGMNLQRSGSSSAANVCAPCAVSSPGQRCKPQRALEKSFVSMRAPPSDFVSLRSTLALVQSGLGEAGATCNCTRFVPENQSRTVAPRRNDHDRSRSRRWRQGRRPVAVKAVCVIGP
jgi:hypothetical protein